MEGEGDNRGDLDSVMRKRRGKKKEAQERDEMVRVEEGMG